MGKTPNFTNSHKISTKKPLSYCRAAPQKFVVIPKAKRLFMLAWAVVATPSHYTFNKSEIKAPISTIIEP